MAANIAPTTGAVYAPISAQLPWHPIVKGMIFALLVWMGSYLGWLPATGILRPATDHPTRRTGLMIAAHLVWGATTGLTVARAQKLLEAPTTHRD